ncbi:hypothetical protein [Capnocytophaga bilenii]
MRAALASHTRLRQLADFPSVRFIFRSSFAHPSLILRSSFVTYSAVPARRLSFAEPSLRVRGRNVG